MDINKIFQEHIAKAKKYIKLQDEGVSQMEAAYKVFGTKAGDELVRLHQHEIIIKTNNN